MKMSLCNTFRYSVICCIIVLSNIDTPATAFTLRHPIKAIRVDRDLAEKETILVRPKRESIISDPVQSINNKTVDKSKDNGSLLATKTMESKQRFEIAPNTTDQTSNIPKESLVSEQTTVNVQLLTTESSTNAITSEVETFTTNFDLEERSSISMNFENISERDTATEFIDLSTSELNSNEFEPVELESLTTSNPNETTTMDQSNGHTITDKHQFTKISKDIIKKQKHFSPSANKLAVTPKWKKYKTIERKRPSYSSEEKLKESKNILKDEILNAETKNVRVSLHDTVTSDIPSLESLKNDLLTLNPKLQTSETQHGVTLTPLVKKESPLNITSSTQLGHESKRAGFLNFSGKTTTSEPTSTLFVTAANATETTAEREKADSKTNIKEPGMLETSSSIIDIVHHEDKNKLESQIVLTEDAMKEELLKERVYNDYEENVKRQREDLNKNKEHKIEEIKSVNVENVAVSNSSSELNDKSTNNDKSKNVTLYTVNANYKPMKKIEVVPPKQFVRDPDDNSWRNESLSSLGIVFKPKNSSKPFTQVLKNKTETEWNNLSEKDIKNDLPDLRERLQKMAEKRKSKRKKIDSFGNIVYFDYEENSSSAERTGVTIDALTSTVTTFSPALQSITQNNGVTTEEPQNVTQTMTTNITTESVNKNSFATTIPKKAFHEYYDSTDEDESDYLNMAKIDLKKFTTSLRTSTPFFPSTIIAKQPDWLKQKSKVTHNVFPERKATVQYFPPLTTQRVNINDYDHGFKFKMESLTTETDVPEHVLPGSTTPVSTPTTPFSTLSANIVNSKKDLTEKVLFTQPYHLTTDRGPSLNDEVSFDRGTYIIKHYKDFVKVAAKDAEYDRNLGYIPYTEAPREGVTKADLIRYEKETHRPVDNGYEDYETQFRKDVLQRFVDNFNQNSDKYRSEFPILFNSSIIHTETQHGKDVASSRAFMRGAYNGKFATPRKTCEPNCDKLVELSPAYELHYYVPDQEEKEEVAPQPVTLPYQYRL